MAIDIVGPVPVSNKGNNNILVMIEYATRYVIAVPLKDTKAPTIVKKFIKYVINSEGIPSELLTDQGKNFQSTTMKELCKQLGIKQLRTTAYHPQTDGAVERANRTIGDMLTAHVHNNPREWDDHLNYVVAAYNRTPHASTGETPFFLIKRQRCPRTYRFKAPDAEQGPYRPKQCLLPTVARSY
jgi:IS30 family transposase